MTRFYSKEDSDEVRRAYYEALKKNKVPPGRQIVTDEVWDELVKRGSDMTRYVRYNELRKEFSFLPNINKRSW